MVRGPWSMVLVCTDSGDGPQKQKTTRAKADKARQGRQGNKGDKDDKGDKGNKGNKGCRDNNHRE
ncbi:hypothetical protein SPI_05865 [Niveomyces insectorum RCEF 264]|uniref:Uncharacterized protein n=1 Tax=Niveomyces insectorum RCEF 264 TaxID=1081102 RepID=A0A167SJ22_9HYPO|nr:hypothetical protein SPI_05865 [Niveomyces insectorum RCEF 264]